MYQNELICGEGRRQAPLVLPPKTLILTFDDGPGPDTVKIAEFLYSQNIRATFFVSGREIIKSMEPLEKIKNYQHIIGNHSYDHLNLQCFHACGGDCISQILRTDEIIKKYSLGNTIYFRPPFGRWSKELMQDLNCNLEVSLGHVGPIGWDFSCNDWDVLNQEFSPMDCVNTLYDNISTKDSGIVLLHDGAGGYEKATKNNRCYEIATTLVTKLQKDGFNFISLDEVEMLSKSNGSKFSLKGINGKYVSVQNNGIGDIFINGPYAGDLEMIHIEKTINDKVTLKTDQGYYFSYQGKKDFSILANSRIIGEMEQFNLITVDSKYISLQTNDGMFLENRMDDHRLRASGFDWNESTKFLVERKSPLLQPIQLYLLGQKGSLLF